MKNIIMMKQLTISTFLILILLMTSCTIKKEGNLSCAEALEKYGTRIGNQSFFVFPELREEPLKWFDSIPEARIKNAGSTKSFRMIAQPGEFYAYQLGVWALKKSAKQVHIEFSDLKNGSSNTIAAAKMTCFNEGGLDYRGNSFSKEINVPAGRLQSLWIGLDLEGVKDGNYSGSVAVVANGQREVVPLQLKVSGEAIPNHGYNEGKRLSRLNWLNSTVGIDQEITNGYDPVRVEENKISILGRTLNISGNGLPASITSFFGASNQSLVKEGEPVVNHPFRFIVEKENGEVVRLTPVN